MTELSKTYNHTEVEDKIYKLWMDSGYFNPDNLPDADKREPYSISLPPPNVTGTLHLGHAFEDTMQDIVIRYQRMLGKKTLWLPGTDHAPIATESKVAKMIEKAEKKTQTGFWPRGVCGSRKTIRPGKPRHHSEPGAQNGRIGRLESRSLYV